MDKKEEAKVTITVQPVSRVVSLVPGSGGDLPKETHEKLGDFFSWLHPLIIPPSTAPQGTIPKMKPRDLFDYALDNPTLLMACIHGLTTGWPRIRVDQIKKHDFQDYQSQFLALIAAHDLMIRCNTKYPLHFQLMLGDQIEMQHVYLNASTHPRSWRKFARKL